ncbi:MAG TPA: GtrA family protein, partial [Vicinamibacterales bacterium]|nr:GtrA family protein [Vicinamibacterales bacterium]
MESPLPLRRWLVFNGVGAMGFVLQLAALGAMVHIGGLHYLVATVIAVEAAILHNYVWHLRWTWRDRPGRGVRNSLARLGRFHALNGAVSVGGNLVLMALLVGGAGIAPVEASAIAVLVCSLV